MSFLLGLRRLLIKWGFTKSKPRVNEGNNTLTERGNPNLKVTVAANRLALEWMQQDWKDCRELFDSSELSKLKEKAEETLTKADEAKAKGDGKGNNGH